MVGGFVGFLVTTRTTGEMNSVTRTENQTTTRLTSLVRAQLQPHQRLPLRPAAGPLRPGPLPALRTLHQPLLTAPTGPSRQTVPEPGPGTAEPPRDLPGDGLR